ncbi:MAG: S-layer homology domain-containing protein, partial [Clostridiaceae bacterium]|nr:S-layer homology domain-containing protein [Clostridiaceae bacterium]
MTSFKTHLKKMLSFTLILFLLVGTMQVNALNMDTTGSEAIFTDMPDDWSTAALKHAVENGLLVGSGGKILPNDYLTRAQMAAVIVRAFNASEKADLSGYSDVKPTDWFADSMAQAHKMGVMQGSNGKMYPANFITRQEVCAVMARAFKLEPEEKINKTFTDADKISDWAKGEVYAVVNGGYIQGHNGILDPLGYVTRAQFAQIFYNFIKQYIRTPGEYTKVADGNIMINTPDVTLKDV